MLRKNGLDSFLAGQRSPFAVGAFVGLPVKAVCPVLLLPDVVTGILGIPIGG